MTAECIPTLIDGTYHGCGACPACRDQADAEQLAHEELEETPGD